MKISTLRSKRAEAVAVIDGEEFKFAYNPKAFNTSLQEELLAAGGTGTALPGILSRVVLDWDLQDDDGKQLPVTVETLKELAIADLGAIFEAMGEQLNPNSTASTSISG